MGWVTSLARPITIPKHKLAFFLVGGFVLDSTHASKRLAREIPWIESDLFSPVYLFLVICCWVFVVPSGVAGRMLGLEQRCWFSTTVPFSWLTMEVAAFGRWWLVLGYRRLVFWDG